MSDIKFLPNNSAYKIRNEESLLDFALKNRIDLDHSCGGMGSCGTCRLIVVEGIELLPPRNEIEGEMAESRCFKPEERLACQNKPVKGLVVEVPDKNLGKINARKRDY